MNRFTSPQPVARAAWTESLGQLAPLDAAAVLGEPQAYWARASEDVALAGFGLAQTVGLDARDGSALLESLAADVAIRQDAAPGIRLAAPPLVGGTGLPRRVRRTTPAGPPFGAARFELPRLTCGARRERASPRPSRRRRKRRGAAASRRCASSPVPARDGRAAARGAPRSGGSWRLARAARPGDGRDREWEPAQGRARAPHRRRGAGGWAACGARAAGGGRTAGDALCLRGLEGRVVRGAHPRAPGAASATTLVETEALAGTAKVRRGTGAPRERAHPAGAWRGRGRRPRGARAAVPRADAGAHAGPAPAARRGASARARPWSHPAGRGLGLNRPGAASHAGDRRDSPDRGAAVPLRRTRASIAAGTRARSGAWVRTDCTSRSGCARR